MGFFGGKSSGSEQGRSSGQGGNGNVRDSRRSAAGKHSAVETPNLQAVRNLQTGSTGYVGRHRAE